MKFIKTAISNSITKQITPNKGKGFFEIENEFQEFHSYLRPVRMTINFKNMDVFNDKIGGMLLWKLFNEKLSIPEEIKRNSIQFLKDENNISFRPF